MSCGHCDRDRPADVRGLAGTAEDAYAIGNAAPGLTGHAAELAERYAQRQFGRCQLATSSSSARPP